jgi:hypothetical protein
MNLPQKNMSNGTLSLMAATYPVLPHTSIPVLTADEQQMFHFFLS